MVMNRLVYQTDYPSDDCSFDDLGPYASALIIFDDLASFPLSYVGHSTKQIISTYINKLLVKTIVQLMLENRQLTRFMNTYKWIISTHKTSKLLFHSLNGINPLVLFSGMLFPSLGDVFALL